MNVSQTPKKRQEILLWQRKIEKKERKLNGKFAMEISWIVLQHAVFTMLGEF